MGVSNHYRQLVGDLDRRGLVAEAAALRRMIGYYGYGWEKSNWAAKLRVVQRAMVRLRGQTEGRSI